MTLESIKSKIAALLAKAESTNNAFEAEAFMAKVNELLEKHQIEMHEIRGAQGDKDPVGAADGETNIYVSIGWARNVASSLARYYGCRTIWFKIGNHLRYEVMGRESARQTFELMLPFIISQVKQQAKRLRADNASITESVWQREVGQALWVRIHNMIPKAEERRAELSANALIPVDEVDAFFDARHPTATKGKPKPVRFTEAARDAASKISLHVQATGTGRTKLLK